MRKCAFQKIRMQKYPIWLINFNIFKKAFIINYKKINVLTRKKACIVNDS